MGVDAKGGGGRLCKTLRRGESPKSCFVFMNWLIGAFNFFFKME